MRLFKKGSRFGLIPDKKDNRDFIYKTRKMAVDLPETTDKRNIALFPWRYDQEDIGSCVAHGGMVEPYRAILKKNGLPDFAPSPLFGYWIAREDKNNDTGASIRDAFKAMNVYGLCAEKRWPYMAYKFALTPNSLAFVDALDHQSIMYERIYPVTQNAIMDVLSRGFPVTFGMELYQSFMNVTKNGIVKRPNRWCDRYLGGHCLLIFDYDKDYVTILNSWGRSWGDDGLCYVPWSYILDSKLARDFWILHDVE